jgi:hypothetical protein
MHLRIQLPRGSWYVRLHGSRRRDYSLKPTERIGVEAVPPFATFPIYWVYSVNHVAALVRSLFPHPVCICPRGASPPVWSLFPALNQLPSVEISPLAVRVNTSAAHAGMLNTTAERSELLHLARSQPSADTNEQLHSRRPFIPADLVQNTAEYLGRVAGLLSFRGVATEWQGAVSDAVVAARVRTWATANIYGRRPAALLDALVTL